MSGNPNYANSYHGGNTRSQYGNLGTSVLGDPRNDQATELQKKRRLDTMTLPDHDHPFERRIEPLDPRVVARLPPLRMETDGLPRTASGNRSDKTIQGNRAGLNLPPLHNLFPRPPSKGFAFNLPSQQQATPPSLKVSAATHHLQKRQTIIEPLTKASAESLQRAKEFMATKVFKELAPIGVNVIFEGALLDNLPAVYTTTFEWVPVAPCFMDHWDGPPSKPNAASASLPYCTHKYSLEPPCTDASKLNTLLRAEFKTKEWDRKDRPTMDLITGKGTAQVVLKFASPELHCKMELQLKELSLEDGDGNDKITYKMKLVGSGLRVQPEVFGVDFTLVENNLCSSAPISHEKVIQIAVHFAHRCQATDSDEYPEARHGITGIWRQQMVEKDPDGTLICTNTNKFYMTMWIPPIVERKRFEPYHTLSDNEKFSFRFPGSEVFCHVHADNKKHPDGKCSLKRCGICESKGHSTKEHSSFVKTQASKAAAAASSSRMPSGRHSLPLPRGGSSRR